MTNEQTNLGAINQALHQLMDTDEQVVVIGEDVGVNGGVFRATDGLYKKHKHRVYDTPLAESGVIGTSIGLALSGLKPVAEIQFSGFMYLAHNQLVSHAARYRLRSGGKKNIPLVVRSPHHGGFRPLEHHAESHESIYTQHPGLKVCIPSTPYDTKGMLVASINDPDPVIFLEPIRLYRAFKQDIPKELYEIPIGKAALRTEGTDLTLVTWGSMTKTCRELTQELDVGIELIDLRSIVPFDEKTVLESVRKTGRCVIVHEAPQTGGFGAEIAARIQEQALLSLNAPIIRVTGYDIPYPFFSLEQEFIPSKQRIIEGINAVMEY